MSEVRKKALKYLGYIVLAVLIIIPAWEQTNANALGYLGLIGFLIAMVNLVRILFLSQELIDDFFIPKGEIETKPTDKFIGWIAMILFFGGMVWQIFEIKIIENTIDGMLLFLLFGLIGIAVGIIILFLLHRVQPTVFYDSSRRYSVYFGILLGLGLLFPAGASYFNRISLIRQNQLCESVELNRKSTSSGRSKSKYLFVTINQSEKRIEVTDEVWNTITEGQLLELCVKPGKLGFKVITKVEKTD